MKIREPELQYPQGFEHWDARQLTAEEREVLLQEYRAGLRIWPFSGPPGTGYNTLIPKRR